MQSFELVIIGGGPIGLNCAIEAKKAGLNYVVLEKGVLVNSLYNFPINMTFFSTSNLLEIGNVPFIAHSDKPTRSESLEYFRRVQESWDLNVQLYTEVTSMTATADGLYQIDTAKGSVQTKSVIVATGFYDSPRMLNIPGEASEKISHYYHDAHPYIGQELLIIGAANSACDVALEAYHKGAKVTMAIREQAIYPKVKYWIKPNIENRIKDGSIKAFFNTNVKEIRENEVVLETPAGEQIIKNDFVLAMTGYQPNYALFNALGLGIDNDEFQTPILNEKTLESSLTNVYLAGVINAGLKTSTLFIENTRVHAAIIMNNIKQKKST